MIQKETKKILFITGTRADYGKIKSLMKTMDESEEYTVYIYVSGMHLLSQYGNTYKEVLKDRYQNVHVAFGQQYTDDMSYNLGSVLTNLTGYVRQVEPDMILVHGDRIDALAGAITGALNNILVAHIEGGEVSGTIDDSIRHAISKFAHLHFVCNEEAKKRIIQLGESEDHIFVIGSPDIDVMLSDSLPSLETVKKYYDIDFNEYGIFLYHPVTTEVEELSDHIDTIVSALKASGKNYVCVYPNNDLGSEIILNKIKKLKGKENFAVYPSIRFEYFLTLLKNASCIIGNSSAGIRESGIYGVPAIDIGTRQKGRYNIHKLPNIQHIAEKEPEILNAVFQAKDYAVKCHNFGMGHGTENFLKVLENDDVWNCGIQKTFVDLDNMI
ncbi:MAG: UDP-N-acetylglucosamine 2-epimerase (hydrolyzing) [Lachnospiraceae bacterium]|nr:UDP-N-acetylglucosamine 2-epimerase (hydrolyzing) [Lachnospiraceae bacterium]